MIWMRTVAMMVAVVALTGCVRVQPVDTATLNDALADGYAFDTVEPVSCLRVDVRQTCLRPGMQLEIQQSSAAPNNNSIVPVVTRFAWIIPRPDEMTQSDLFALSYVISAALSSKRGSGSECLEAGVGLAGDARTRFFADLIQGMTVEWGQLNSPTPVHSAQAIQAWMRQLPTSPEPPRLAPARSKLLVTMPRLPAGTTPDPCDLVTLVAFNDGSAWQMLGDAPGDFGGVSAYPPAAPFYKDVVHMPRTFLSVLVPVSMGGAIHYVPIDSSLADIERLAGQRVKSVSRVAALRTDKVQLTNDAARFSIVLTSGNWAVSKYNTLELPRGCAADILVAAGDQIAFSSDAVTADDVRSVSCLAN